MRSETRQTYVERIQHAVETALSNLDEHTEGAQLAEAAGFSPFHFSRMFAGMLGESPGVFLRRLKLERAAHRLRNTGQPIGEIALDAGYEGPEAFTRAFRAAFYMSPTDYRRGELAHRLPSLSGVHYAEGVAAVVIAPRDTGGKNINVEIRDNTPDRRLVALRHVGPYWQIGPAFGRLGSWLGQNQVQPCGPCIAIYYDDPDSVNERELRSDACAHVAPDCEVPQGAEVKVIEMKGGRVAVYSHIGPYSGLTDAWQRFYGEWFPARGLEIDEARTTYEVYVKECGQVPEAELVTELCVPVK